MLHGIDEMLNLEWLSCARQHKQFLSRSEMVGSFDTLNLQQYIIHASSTQAELGAADGDDNQ